MMENWSRLILRVGKGKDLKMSKYIYICGGC